jgi:hypothetical protein
VIFKLFAKLERKIALQRKFWQSPKKTNQKKLSPTEKVLEFCKENCICQKNVLKFINQFVIYAQVIVFD